MITIEKTDVNGWQAAIRGLRNPMNSWAMSDTIFHDDGTPEIGEHDLDLMYRLAMSGSDHRKFLRFITVTTDITAPLYWWKQFDAYHVGTVTNSCSTMHKIHAKEFTLDDFSHEHLLGFDRASETGSFTFRSSVAFPEHEGSAWVLFPRHVLKTVIEALNANRKAYLETKDKKYWWQMIQLLPDSYNQKRTMFLNYEVLRNMYHARKNHKLDEWHDFCAWVEGLPYAGELITGREDAG